MTLESWGVFKSSVCIRYVPWLRFIAKCVDQTGANAFDRQHVDCRAQRHRRLRHSVDCTRRLVLRNGVMAFVAQCFESLRAIASHACEQYADGLPAPRGTHTVEKHIDRGPVGTIARFTRVAQAVSVF